MYRLTGNSCLHPSQASCYSAFKMATPTPESTSISQETRTHTILNWGLTLVCSVSILKYPPPHPPTPSIRSLSVIKVKETEVKLEEGHVHMSLRHLACSVEMARHHFKWDVVFHVAFFALPLTCMPCSFPSV